jgi:hypothetical protein
MASADGVGPTMVQASDGKRHRGHSLRQQLRIEDHRIGCLETPPAVTRSSGFMGHAQKLGRSDPTSKRGISISRREGCALAGSTRLANPTTSLTLLVTL